MGRVAGLTADETRRRVLEAAAAVFAECGFDGARIAHIADTAGLSSGAIYNHWRSKAELLGAVVEARAAHELTEVLAATGDQAGGVLDVVARLGARLDQPKEAASLLPEAILAARREPEMAPVMAQEVLDRERLLADLLRHAQAAGEAVEDVSADVVARFCLMLGLGSLLVRALGLPPTDQDDWTAFITRLVDGFRPEET